MFSVTELLNVALIICFGHKLCSLACKTSDRNDQVWWEQPFQFQRLFQCIGLQNCGLGFGFPFHGCQKIESNRIASKN